MIQELSTKTFEGGTVFTIVKDSKTEKQGLLCGDNTILELDYESITMPYNKIKIALVSKDGKYGIVSCVDGSVLIPLEYEDADAYNKGNGIILGKSGTKGVCFPSGGASVKMLIPCKYSSIKFKDDIKYYYCYDAGGDVQDIFSSNGIKPAIFRFGGGEGVHHSQASFGFGAYLDEEYGDSLSLPFGFSRFVNNLEAKHLEGLFTKYQLKTINEVAEREESPGYKFEYNPNGASSQYVWHYPDSEGRYYLPRTIQNHACSQTTACKTCGGTGICQECDGRGYDRCEYCEGTGKVSEMYFDFKTNKPKYRKVACPKCHGSRKVLCSACGGTKKCSNCAGSGRVTCIRCQGTGNYQTYDVMNCKFSNISNAMACIDAPSTARISEDVLDSRDMICVWFMNNNYYSDSKAINSRQYANRLFGVLEDYGFDNAKNWSDLMGETLGKKEKELFDKGYWSVEMEVTSYGCPVTCYTYSFEGKDYTTYVVGRRPKRLYGTYPTSYFWENYKLKTSFFSKIKHGLSLNVEKAFQSDKNRLSKIRQSLVLLAARMMLKSPKPEKLDKYYKKFKISSEELKAINSIDVEKLSDKEFYKKISNLRQCPAAVMWAYTYAFNKPYYREAAISLGIDDSELFEKIETWYKGDGLRSYGEEFVLEWFASKVSSWK